MAENSSIEWTDHTFNPWIGCTKVSPGCDHCYAEQRMDQRLHQVQWGPGAQRVRTKPANWAKPLRWNATPFYECSACRWRGSIKAASADSHGPIAVLTCPNNCDGVLRLVRQRVFCASLADVFDNEAPPEWRADLFDLIRRTPNLDWLLLTKRIGNAARMTVEALGGSERDALHSMPRNIWLGATIVNQEEADRDIPKLLAIPTRVRFLSMEPLLGPVDLTRVGAPAGYPALSWDTLQSGQPARIDWAIVGGESGPQARPMHPDWARSLRDQCAAAGVPFLFKQWGEWLPGSQARDVGNQISQVGACNRGWKWDNGTHSWRIGKKAAGRLLDGVEHNGFPEVAP